MDIDNEIRAIIDGCYRRAKDILVENREKLEMMAEALMQYETLDREQIDAIMEGRKPEPPKGWGNRPNTARGESAEAPLADKPAGGGKPLPPIGGPATQL
jgi:cell division protease FtsH